MEKKRKILKSSILWLAVAGLWIIGFFVTLCFNKTAFAGVLAFLNFLCGAVTLGIAVYGFILCKKTKDNEDENPGF